MTVLQLEANGLLLTVKDESKNVQIPTGNVNSIEVHVMTDTSWIDYGKSAVLYNKKQPDMIIEIPMESTALNECTCKIPGEVLTEDGRLYIGIRGVNDTIVKATNLVFVEVINGAIHGRMAEPTDDVYDQILSNYGKLEKKLNTLIAGKDYVSESMYELNVKNINSQTSRVYSNGAMAYLYVVALFTPSTNYRTFCTLPTELAPLYEPEIKSTKEGLTAQFYNKLASDVWELQYKLDGEAGASGTLTCVYPLKNIAFPEVVDMRLDADGVQHETAGDAIRSQFEKQEEIHGEQDEKIKKNADDIEAIKYDEESVISTYLVTNSVWNLKNVNVGTDISGIVTEYLQSYFVHKHEIRKGDILVLGDSSVWCPKNTAYSDSLVITDKDCVVAEKVSFDDLIEAKEHTFAEDGFFYLCTESPASSGVEMFKIKRPLEARVERLETQRKDYANAIKGHLTGAVVATDDVSPVEHVMDVMVHGKNRFFSNADMQGTLSGISYSVAKDTSSLTLNGTAINENALALPDSFILEAGTYTASVIGSNEHDSGGNDRVLLRDIETNEVIINHITVTTPRTFTLHKKTAIRSYFVFKLNSTYNNQTISIQIEKGAEATDYEPYIDPSTVNVRRCGKNIFGVAGKTQTINGVTFTVNNDGTVIANGTATKATFMGLGSLLLKPDEKYRLSGSPAGSGFDTYLLYIHNNTTGADIYDLGEGKVFTGKEGDLGLTIAVYAGNTVNNLIFHPMVVCGEEITPFEPYNGTKYIPASDGTVTGMTSLSPNMTILTDTEGAVIECEYIKDTNKVIQKIADALGISI